MTSMLLKDVSESLNLSTSDSEEYYTITNVSWQQYEALAEKELPDLAIEVVVTSGNVDKLIVYQRLGVQEVWFWRQGQLQVHCLRDGGYEQTAKSELLPSLDLNLLASYVEHPEPLDAVLEFRAKMREHLEN